MFRRLFPVIVGAVIALALIGSCGASATPEPIKPTAEPAAGGQTQVNAEAFRDGVFVIEAGAQRTRLPAPQARSLSVGDGVDVDDQGLAVLRFADALTVEVLRRTGLVVQEAQIDDQSAVVSLLQDGGALVNDFHPRSEIERRLTIKTEFAVITATGTRFIVSREPGTPLEWIIALEATGEDLTVTAGDVTKPVPAGVARWVAPEGEPSAGIDANMANVSEWLQGMEEGVAVPPLGELVWPQADVLADTSQIQELPDEGTPFVVDGVSITLDPNGPFGDADYWLEDCNGDGIGDIAIEAGLLHMDFRGVLSRVRALDVTVMNWVDPDTGVLEAFNPGRELVGVDHVTAGPDQIDVLSVRSDQPYHYADLTMLSGCFLGFSLTPPRPDGSPGEPRSPVSLEGAEGEIRRPWVAIVQPDEGQQLGSEFVVTGEAVNLEGRPVVLYVADTQGQLLYSDEIELPPAEPGQRIAFKAWVTLAPEASGEIIIQVLVWDDDLVVTQDERRAWVVPSEVSPRPPEELPAAREPVLSASPVDAGEIRLDGALDDWASLEEQGRVEWSPIEAIVWDQNCARTATRPSLSRLPNWVDLDARVAFAYDADALYVAFQVADDSYFPYRGEDLRFFLGDAPQLSIDADLQGDFTDAAASRDDWQVDIHPGLFDGDFLYEPPRIALWTLAPARARNFAEAKAMSARFAGGYFVEAALPWRAFGIKPYAGLPLGLAASVSDNDYVEEDIQECMISTSPKRQWDDPTTWGTLMLLGSE